MTAKFIICSDWGHIFSDGKERTCRWVYDTEQHKLVAAQVYYDRFEDATDVALADLEDSIVGTNWEMLDEPEENDLERSDTLPGWVRTRRRSGRSIG